MPLDRNIGCGTGGKGPKERKIEKGKKEYGEKKEIVGLPFPIKAFYFSFSCPNFPLCLA
jgi:hypothetical protein